MWNDSFSCWWAGKTPLPPSSVTSFQRQVYGALSKASLMGRGIHTNMLTKIIFTIHRGLATVTLEVIIDGNQMLNPSAVWGCKDYLQVMNLILSLLLREELLHGFNWSAAGDAKGRKMYCIHLHWNSIQCNLLFNLFNPGVLSGPRRHPALITVQKTYLTLFYQTFTYFRRIKHDFGLMVCFWVQTSK